MKQPIRKAVLPEAGIEHIFEAFLAHAVDRLEIGPSARDLLNAYKF